MSGYQMLHPLPDDPRNVLIARYHFADGGTPKAHRLDMFSGKVDYLGGQVSDNDLVNLVADNSGVIRAAVAFKAGDTLDDRTLRLYTRADEDSKWESFDFDTKRTAPDLNFMGFSEDNRRVYFSSDHDMAKERPQRRI